jgi:hypothetical protein
MGAFLTDYIKFSAKDSCLPEFAGRVARYEHIENQAVRIEIKNRYRNLTILQAFAFSGI